MTIFQIPVHGRVRQARIRSRIALHQSKKRFRSMLDLGQDDVPPAKCGHAALLDVSQAVDSFRQQNGIVMPDGLESISC